jgi:ABC-2 type transport system permease protein
MTTMIVPVRRIPPHGGFNMTFLALEIRRLLRNSRTVIFTLVLPVVFFLIFGAHQSYSNERAGSGNVEAFIMISMAVYGAMLGTTATGAMVSVERAQGWSRQLRLTPLKPVAHIAIKVLTATLVGLASIAAVYLAGAITGAHMPVSVWVETALIAWIGSLVLRPLGYLWGICCPPRMSCKSWARSSRCSRSWADCLSRWTYSASLSEPSHNSPRCTDSTSLSMRR